MYRQPQNCSCAFNSISNTVFPVLLDPLLVLWPRQTVSVKIGLIMNYTVLVLSRSSCLPPLSGHSGTT